VHPTDQQLQPLASVGFHVEQLSVHPGRADKPRRKEVDRRDEMAARIVCCAIVVGAFLPH